MHTGGSIRYYISKIKYIKSLDLTRQYHNLLMSEDKAEQKEQTFYWDGNVAAMEEGETDSYYLLDLLLFHYIFLMGLVGQ